MKPPFRADHVGSLLRPQELHEARAKNRRGELSGAELKAIQDRDIREVVKMQESLGLQAITDGEFRRDWWHIDFIHGFDGVDLTVNKQHTFHASDEQPPMFKLSGKVRRTKPSMRIRRAPSARQKRSGISRGTSIARRSTSSFN